MCDACILKYMKSLWKYEKTIRCYLDLINMMSSYLQNGKGHIKKLLLLCVEVDIAFIIFLLVAGNIYRTYISDIISAMHKALFIYYLVFSMTSLLYSYYHCIYLKEDGIEVQVGKVTCLRLPGSKRQNMY